MTTAEALTSFLASRGFTLVRVHRTAFTVTRDRERYTAALKWPLQIEVHNAEWQAGLLHAITKDLTLKVAGSPYHKQYRRSVSVAAQQAWCDAVPGLEGASAEHLRAVCDSLHLAVNPTWGEGALRRTIFFALEDHSIGWPAVYHRLQDLRTESAS